LVAAIQFVLEKKLFIDN